MRKVAVVTGASKGIGKACAIRLAREGFAVVVNYSRSQADADAVVEEITKAGGTAMAYRADVSDPQQVQSLFRTVAETYGGVDVLINNAGMVKDEYLLMLKEETLNACLDLNIKGYLYCAQQAALKMMANKSGVIVNLSSVSGQIGLAGQAVYSATKGAVNSMTRTLAVELARYGIRVNAVAPGFVETDMVAQLPEAKKQQYLKEVPMHRFATTEEVADAVAFLCSDQSGYMTGQVLVLDGGLSL